MSRLISSNNPIILKKTLLKIIEKRLRKRELGLAKVDWHSKRKPIGCGLTIHPGTGCPLQCSYCYIYDMGFNRYAIPYSLSGLQLVAALLYNKYFYPTRWGTYLAFGSVTEPFLPNITPKTLEYLKVIAEYLDNPCQVSTKIAIKEELAEELANIKGTRLSILVTVTSLNQYVHLEEKAPHPFERLESLKRLKAKGFKPFIFMRPLLPGLKTEEVEEVINQAKASGAYGIVVGNLRLSPTIVKRLSEKGVDVTKFLNVDFKDLRKGFKDIRVNGGLVAFIREIALNKGLIFLRRACCANTVSQFLQGCDDVICPSQCFLDESSCEKTCPSQCARKARGEPKHLDMHEVIRSVLGFDDYEVEVKDHTIHLKLKRAVVNEKLASFSLSYLLRRKIRFIKH
ncbi:MAG: radical SAM protein [Candidatus Nezhaarchaeota archaeon]|nr:radical SAM protein [Candidatus Nezhaarchaeota archaeon]